MRWTGMGFSSGRVAIVENPVRRERSITAQTGVQKPAIDSVDAPHNLNFQLT